MGEQSPLPQELEGGRYVAPFLTYDHLAPVGSGAGRRFGAGLGRFGLASIGDVPPQPQVLRFAEDSKGYRAEEVRVPGAARLLAAARCEAADYVAIVSELDGQDTFTLLYLDDAHEEAAPAVVATLPVDFRHETAPTPGFENNPHIQVTNGQRMVALCAADPSTDGATSRSMRLLFSHYDGYSVREVTATCRIADCALAFMIHRVHSERTDLIAPAEDAPAPP